MTQVQKRYLWAGGVLGLIVLALIVGILSAVQASYGCAAKRSGC